MKDKIIAIMAVILLILLAVIFYTNNKNEKLNAKNTDLENKVKQKEQTIKEMEKVNDLFTKAEKENEKFKHDLSNDSDRNLDVSPSAYILDRMHAD